jgi:hypothetical protein
LAKEIWLIRSNGVVILGKWKSRAYGHGFGEPAAGLLRHVVSYI